jgi:hypothetical protein
MSLTKEEKREIISKAKFSTNEKPQFLRRSSSYDTPIPVIPRANTEDPPQNFKRFSRSASYSGPIPIVPTSELSQKPKLARATTYGGERPILFQLPLPYKKPLPPPLPRRNYFWELVYKYPNKPWNWYEVSKNPNITSKILKDYKNDKNLRWNKVGLWENPNTFPDEKTIRRAEWKFASRNPNITWDMVRNISDDLLDWFYLSKNPSIDWKIIKENVGKPWDWRGLSRNPNTTLEIVMPLLTAPWDWGALTANRGITWNDVWNNFDLPWIFDNLSINPNITWENVDDPFTEDVLDWKFISMHKNMTWDIITTNIRRITGERVPWKWNFVTANPNVSWENILLLQKLFGFEFDWALLSKNRNLTPKIINEKIENWNWEEFSKNEFNYGKTMEAVVEVEPPVLRRSSTYSFLSMRSLT